MGLDAPRTRRPRPRRCVAATEEEQRSPYRDCGLYMIRDCGHDYGVRTPVQGIRVNTRKKIRTLHGISVTKLRSVVWRHFGRTTMIPTAVHRVSKGTFHAARHSVLDEIVFNRDFDKSRSSSINRGRDTWTFQPSYSGFQSLALQMRPDQSIGRLPAMMMDDTVSSQASLPQIVAHGSRASSIQIKHNPALCGFVTEKVTKLPFAPGHRPDANFGRLKNHVELRNHESDLIINLNTPNQFPPSPFTPMFRPLGSVQPNVQPPGRPVTTHQPGRHRFFISDITPKIGSV